MTSDHQVEFYKLATIVLLYAAMLILGPFYLKVFRQVDDVDRQPADGEGHQHGEEDQASVSRIKLRLVKGFICIDIFHLLEAFRLDEDKIDFFGACNTLNILTYTIRLEIENLVI